MQSVACFSFFLFDGFQEISLIASYSRAVIRVLGRANCKARYVSSSLIYLTNSKMFFGATGYQASHIFLKFLKAPAHLLSPAATHAHNVFPVFTIPRSHPFLRMTGFIDYPWLFHIKKLLSRPLSLSSHSFSRLPRTILI